MASLRPLIGVLALAVLLAARTLPELAEDLMLTAADSVPGLCLTVAQDPGALAGLPGR